MTGNVGMDLRHARERAHLSLEDLSARTKIRPALLSMIEREEFERLPAGLLTRGFLRAYAREVGLDPELIVRMYVEEFEPERLARVPPPPERHDVDWDPIPSSRTRWAFLAPAIPLALAAVFFLRMSRAVEVSAVPPASQPAAVGTTGDPVEAAAIQRTTAIAASEPAAVAAPPAAADSVRLDIQPTAEVWVEATADGTPVLRELVGAGEIRTLEAIADISLRIGDAAAFAYAINGRPGRTLGGPGRVRDVRITRENYTEFLTE